MKNVSDSSKDCLLYEHSELVIPRLLENTSNEETPSFSLFQERTWDPMRRKKWEALGGTVVVLKRDIQV